MALLQGLLFLVFGLGLLLVDYRSLARGCLPCGSNGLGGRLEFRKDRQPMMYWVLFALYAVAGLALTILALRVLAGIAAPLPLR
jgi:hypothetical protein